MATMSDSTSVEQFHDWRKFYWTTPVQGNGSQTLALWNHLENFKKKILMLCSTPRYSGFTGMKVVWAQSSLKDRQVILTCSQVLEPLVEENTLRFSCGFWYHLSLVIQVPQSEKHETRENGY